MNEFTGVIGDPREDDRVINGFSVDTILPSAAAFNWIPGKKLVSYPVWDQAGTSACVAFSKAKQLSIKIFNLTGVWIDFSPASIYQLRVNAPALGMGIPDANSIVNNHGASLEALMKSQNLTEAQIMAVKRSKVADLFAKAIAEAVVSYFYFPVVDIDRIAQAIQAGKAVSLLIFATSHEYSRLTPVIENPDLIYALAPVRHEIVAVDYFLSDDGVKTLHCNDSAHFAGLALRNITEDFLLKRCILADCLDVFTFDPGTGDKPTYDESIISLQKCLRFEGLFPVEIGFVESYGPITKKAVIDFQKKYNIPSTGIVGDMTKGQLKTLYP